MDDLTAIATGGELVALAFGMFELAARRRASARSQADEIGAWIAAAHQGGGQTAVIINNSSTQPVYDLAAVLVFRSGAAPHSGADWIAEGKGGRLIKIIAQVPPGRFIQWLPTPQGSPMGSGGVLLVEMAFTEQAGQHWQRIANGRLRKLRGDAIETYQLGRPTGFATLGKSA